MWRSVWMKIAICSDHRGYILKTDLVKKMKESGISFEDYGCFSEEETEEDDQTCDQEG